MALELVFDNQAERLAERVARLCGPSASRTPYASGAPGTPPGSIDPFAEDLLIVPSLGVGRWLKRRIARERSVAAAIRIELPGRALWSIAARLLTGVGERSPFEPEQVRWALLGLLDGLALDDEPRGEGFDLLRARLRNSGRVQRLRLAQDIAQLFERYLAWRRDWLDAWRDGRPIVDTRLDAIGSAHQQWQSWLWRALLQHLPQVSDRHPFDRLRECFEQWMKEDGPRVAADHASPSANRLGSLGLRQLIVFGCMDASGEELGLLAMLSRWMDVTLLMVEPSREFWHDIVSPRQLARLKATHPDEAWLFEQAPAVLGQWGQAHRDALARLRALEESLLVWPLEWRIDDGYRERMMDPPPHRLARLQQSMLSLSPASAFEEPDGADEADGSIEIHACHGIVRQVEVLRDRLIHALARDRSLGAGDVAVFCVDLDRFAPAIEAVFSDGPLPWKISGRSPSARPLAAAVLSLLRMAIQGAPRSAVEAFFENEAVAEALRLDSQRQARLPRWLADAGAFSGLGDEGGRHGWRAALDRLWLGLAISTDAFDGDRAILADQLVVPGAGVDPGLLGLLEQLIDSLSRLAREAASCRTPDQWTREVQLALRWLLDARALDREPWIDEVLAIRSAFDGLRQGEAGEGIDLAAWVEAFEQSLSAGAAPADAAGVVSFMPIGALPGVPFRLIALLGMDAGEFPKAPVPREFDLMAALPRFGDALPRLRDRACFLDLVLAARDRLLIFHRGRNPKDNTELEPSDLVLELIDWSAREDGGTVGGGRGDGRAPLRCVEHPMQPFSPKAFQAPRAQGTDERWYRTALAVVAPASEAPREWSARTAGDSAEAPARQWNHAGLLTALAHPVRAYLSETLGVGLPHADRERADEPPMDATVADPVHLLQQALEVIHDEDALAGRIRAWQCAPELADAGWGQLAQRQLMLRMRQWIGQQQALSDQLGPGQWMQRTINGPGLALESGLLRVDAQGRPLIPARQWTFSAFPVNARALLDAWLRHLAACAWLRDEGIDQSVVTELVARKGDAIVRIPVGEAADAGSAWAGLARQVDELILHPRPIFPRTWLAFRERAKDRALDEIDSTDGAWKAAALALTGSSDDGDAAAWGRRPEIEDPWHRVLYRDRPPALREVIEASDALYLPILGVLASSAASSEPEDGRGD